MSEFLPKIQPRRDFLFSLLKLSAFVSLPSLPFKILASDRSSGQVLSSYNLTHGNKMSYGVGVFDLNNKTFSTIETPFLVHSLSQKSKTNIFVGTERHGPNICLIDINKKRIIAHKKFTEETMLYGHTLFSPIGDFLLGTVEIKNKDYNNKFLGYFDTKNLEIKNKFNLTGSFQLHDCNFLDHQRLALPQGNSVHIIDFKKNKILKSYTIGQLPQQAWIGHSYAWKDQILFFTINELTKKDSSEKSPYSLAGGLDINTGVSRLFKIRQEDFKMYKSEMLSLSCNFTGDVLGTASPWDNQISFWSYKENRIIKSYADNFPAGISFSNSLDCFISVSNEGLRYFSKDGKRELDFSHFKKEVKSLFTQLGWENNRFYHSTFA